jgi:hypothetical protein
VVAWASDAFPSPRMSRKCGKVTAELCQSFWPNRRSRRLGVAKPNGNGHRILSQGPSVLTTGSDAARRASKNHRARAEAQGVDCSAAFPRQQHLSQGPPVRPSGGVGGRPRRVVEDEVGDLCWH